MTIVKWLVFIVGGFAFLITAVFSVMLIMQSPKDAQPAKSKIRRNGKTQVQTQTVASNSAINNYKAKLIAKDQQIDSLKQIAAEKDKLVAEVARLNAIVNGISDQSARAKEIAKTLSSMKPKAMAPILKKLDDDTIILIYQQTGKPSRKDILLALSDSRAAKITKKLILNK